jgi:hypothetical protein
VESEISSGIATRRRDIRFEPIPEQPVSADHDREEKAGNGSKEGRPLEEVPEACCTSIALRKILVVDDDFGLKGSHHRQRFDKAESFPLPVKTASELSGLAASVGHQS